MSNGQALEALRTDGYVMLRDVLADGVLEQARNALLPLLDRQAWGKGEFFGNRTRRVHNILAKTRAVDPLAAHPAVLELLRGTLIQPQVSLVNAIENPPGGNISFFPPGRCGIPVPSSAPASDRQHHVGPHRVHRREWRDPPGATQSGRDRVGRESFDHDRGDGTRGGPGLERGALPRRGCQLRATTAPRIERELQLRLASPAGEPISR